MSLDPQLRYSTHIHHISVQAHKSLQMIKALTATGWGNQKETLMSTYKAVMRPGLEYACCFLPTPMTLAGGRSPMFPLVVHQPASPSICCLPTPMTLARGGGVRCSRLWSTSHILRPSGQQCSHSGGICPQIQT